MIMVLGVSLWNEAMHRKSGALLFLFAGRIVVKRCINSSESVVKCRESVINELKSVITIFRFLN